MSSIDQLFTDLRAAGRKAFIPFVTAGDPDLEFTAAMLRELVSRGCSLCEVGIPYSDPIADGPVIQASYTRALGNGVKLHQIFEMIDGVTHEISAPIVTMVSYAIVYRHGLEAYVTDAQRAGVSGAIIPDLPVEEAGEFSRLCRSQDFSLIQLITPTTPRDRAVRIAESTTGFIYYVSVTGITGERNQLPGHLIDDVGWLREQTDLPICIGFGISKPDHVRTLAPVSDGLIVGSALVRRIAAVEKEGRNAALKQAGQYADTLIEALSE